MPWHECPNHPNVWSLTGGICGRTIRSWPRCTKCKQDYPLIKYETEEGRKRRLQERKPRTDSWEWYHDDVQCEGLVLHEIVRCQQTLAIVIPSWERK